MKKSILAAAVVVSLLSGETETANAGLFRVFSGSYGGSGSYGSSGGSYGGSSYGTAYSAGSYGSTSSYGGASSYGSYGSYGSGPSYGSSYGSTGSYGRSAGLGSTGSLSNGGSSGRLSRRDVRIRNRAARKAASHGSYGSASTGSASYGSASYGSASYGSASYGSASTGSASYGSASYGTGAYRASTYGSLGARQASTVSSMARVARPAHASPYVIRPTTPPLQPVVRPAPVVQEQAFAYVVVTVPEDAVLYLGGNRTNEVGTVRKFKIPVADENAEYAYNIKAELIRNGQTYVAESTEPLIAGKTISIKVNDVSPTVAAR